MLRPAPAAYARLGRLRHHSRGQPSTHARAAEAALNSAGARVIDECRCCLTIAAPGVYRATGRGAGRGISRRAGKHRPSPTLMPTHRRSIAVYLASTPSRALLKMPEAAEFRRADVCASGFSAVAHIVIISAGRASVIAAAFRRNRIGASAADARFNTILRLIFPRAEGHTAQPPRRHGFRRHSHCLSPRGGFDCRFTWHAYDYRHV